MTLRYAVVTGGSRGIGFEICKQLASKGVMVILTDIQKGSEAIEKLKACGLSDKVVFHHLDVAVPVSVARLAEFVTTQFGKLDILVNNAGINGITYKVEELQKADEAGDLKKPDVDWGKLSTQTYDLAEKCVNINYYGATLMTKALLPLLHLSDSARIVNISSTAGCFENVSNEWAIGVFSDVENLTEDRIKEVLEKFLQDFKDDALEANGWPPVCSAYILSKAAMNAYTRFIAKEYPYILINCVHPGYVKTAISLNTGEITAEEAAVFPVKFALLPNGEPSGLFYSDGVAIPF